MQEVLKEKDKVIKYWRSLFKYLEDKQDLDFKFITSITLTEGIFNTHRDPCDLEAVIVIKKPDGLSISEAVYPFPGHIQECTWID